MTSRVRHLLVAIAVVALAGGCAHRSARTPLQVEPLGPPPGATARSEPSPIEDNTAGPGTQLVLTTQAAHDDLFGRTLDDAPPVFTEPARIFRGQRLFVLPLLRNYAVDSAGRADLALELEIRKPDGTRDGDVLRTPLWEGPVDGPDLLLYPASGISFWTEPRDPTGAYTITARVTDRVAGRTRTLVRTLQMQDYAPPELPREFNAREWFSGYYQTPTPEFALPALARLYLDLPADRRVGALPPILGFYDQLLTDNPWLLPAFCARLAAASPDEAYPLSLALGFHLRHAQTPPAGVDADTWERLADFRTHSWAADPDLPLAEAAQLDALWGRFFASGFYAPLESLLRPLDNHADLGAADRWQLTRDPGAVGQDLDAEALAEAPPEVRRDLLLRSAVWSLRSNARQHRLVRAYLDWTLQTGELPPTQKALLARILRQDPPAQAAGP